MKEKFDIVGMTCSSCSAHVTKAVEDLRIEKCSVNLLTNSMIVQYDDHLVKREEIIKAVSDAGYIARLPGEKKVNTNKTSLIFSTVLLIILVYFSSHSMLHLPYPSVLEANAGLVGIIVQMVLSLAIIIFNFHYFRSGVIHLYHLKPNMDSLIAIGSSASFIYATYNAIMIFIALSNNNEALALSMKGNLYFESSAMILTLVSIGKYFEGLSKKQTTKALESLVNMIPKTVFKKNGEFIEEIPTELVCVGDLLLLKPYTNIAIDGVIKEGESFFDESSITGESLLVHKSVGDEIKSGSVNDYGTILYEATKTSSSSTLAEIVRLVDEASNSKMPIARIADRVSLYFVPIVIFISLLTFIIWLHSDLSFALNMAISVLIISCPCALGLATPLCIMVSCGMAAKKNVLLKDAKAFEALATIDTIVFDKTGTITKGKMQVVDYIEYDKNSLSLLYSLELKANHPLSEAITEYAHDKAELLNIEKVIAIPGKGIKGFYNNLEVYAGSPDYLKEITDISIPLAHTTIVLFTNEKILAIVSLNDELKTDAKKTIDLFKAKGIKPILATGDNESHKKSLSILEIEEMHFRLLPYEKMKLIIKLQNDKHKVLMVGDGINDSIALVTSNVSMAYQGKNDIAANSASIVVLNNDLVTVYYTYELAKKTVKNVKINLFWAFFYNIILIPVAAGAFFNLWGWKLSPMISAICMTLSSICVCLNALRLKRFRLKEEGDYNMKFKVLDMMCEKCVSHIKGALSVEGVSNLSIDLKKKTVFLDTDLSQEEVFDLIKKAGYTPASF